MNELYLQNVDSDVGEDDDDQDDVQVPEVDNRMKSINMYSIKHLLTMSQPSLNQPGLPDVAVWQRYAEEGAE